MSIVSGLVERPTEHHVAQSSSRPAEWMVRNAWGVVIGGSVAFWLILAVLLAVG